MLFLCLLIVSLFLLLLVVVTGAALCYASGVGERPALGERGQGREADFNDGKLLVIVHIIM